MNAPSTNTGTATGWLIQDKGQYYLMTEVGWIQLVGLDRERLRQTGLAPESPVRVSGTRLDSVTMDVAEIDGTGIGPERADGRRPYFAVHPVSALHTGSALRGEAHAWLRDHGYPEIILPTVWRRSEEYGVEEFRLAHSAMPAGGAPLVLLQSSEFALMTALAQGISRIFTFGRCYRFEENPRLGLEGDYLIEFEQLVVATAFTTLEDMMRLTEQLLSHLAGTVGQALRPDDFYRLPAAGGAAAGSGGTPGIEELVLFAVPDGWNAKALRLMIDRLRSAGATVYPMDAREGLTGPDAQLPETAMPGSRWAVAPGPDATTVRHILDISANASAGRRAGAGGNGQSQWNPTWNVHPTLRWGDGEGFGTRHRTRSITSRRVKDADGVDRIADAELYIAGREVAHVREYASVEQFRENLKLAGVEDMEHCYDYLYGPLEIAPPGMIGIFIGWERLLSVLTGNESAADAQLLPRSGDGERRNPTAPI